MVPANVTLRQLRYLTALADALHFGRAAAACHVSQPSLSAQIQQLEDALGASLVERTKHRVLLTSAGEDAVARARTILAAVDDLAQAARAANRPLTGAMRLGVIPTSGPYVLPRLLPPLRQAYPDVRLYLREDLTERLLERLRSGDLDVALMALPLDEAGLVSHPLYEEPFILALPIGDPLDKPGPVALAALSGAPLLLLEDGHCLREQALAACALAGAQVGAAVAATSLSTLTAMVAGGLGRTLLPALAAEAMRAQGGITTRSFIDPQPMRRMGLVWRRGSPRAADARRLGEVLLGSLPKAVVPLYHGGGRSALSSGTGP
jgi:LysR family transcriptional regulator, hydrogen peroxide-inducible genes activator